MTAEDAFQAVLDANPQDWQARLVFADWLDERGDPRADGYRMLGYARMAPAGPGNESQEGQQRWWWLETVTGRSHSCNVKSYWYCHLTTKWCEAPPGFHQSWAGERVVYDSRREAEDDAAVAWSKVDPKKRERDLRDVMPKY